MLRFTFVVLFLFFCDLLSFSQGPLNLNGELISRVYFGTPPYDATDIMNPSSGITNSNCVRYSDFTIGNNTFTDGNLTNTPFFTGVQRDSSYQLEVEGGACSSISVANPNRAIKVYVDWNNNNDFEEGELEYTSSYENSQAPIFNTTITVPNTSVLGEIKMRIVYSRVSTLTFFWEQFPYGITSPLGYSYGEVEDYTLNVIGYMDSLVATNTTCDNTTDGQIEVYPSSTAPVILEYSLDGPLGTWQTNPSFTNLASGTYMIWARDPNLAPNYVYEQLQITVNNSGSVFVTPLINSDYNGFPISCNGGADAEVVLSANGGDNSLYSFQYSSINNSNLINVTGSSVTGLSADTYTFLAIDAQGCSSSPVEIEIIEPQPILIDAVIISQIPSCVNTCDGAVEVVVSGGTSSYNYIIDGTDYGSINNIGGLCSGVQLLEVFDLNGSGFNCSTDLDINIPNPQPIQINTNIVSDYLGYNVSCQDSLDGAIEISATGGTGGEYMFSLDGGLNFPFTSSSVLEIDDLGESTLEIVALDSNLCQSPVNVVNLSAPIPLSFDVISTTSPISCFGYSDGEITLQAANGVGGYAYSIDGGINAQSSGVFSGLSSGNYMVTIVDDNGCLQQDTFILNQPSELVITSLMITSNYNGSQLSCYGDSDGEITVDFNGGTAPYNYVLQFDPTTYPLSSSNTINNLSSGAQSIQAIDDNNCFSTIVEFEIVEPQELTISSVNTVSEVSCFGGSDGSISISASGGTGPYNYFVDNIYNSANQQPFTVSGLTANNYDVFISDQNGCLSQSVSHNIQQPLQINPNLSITNIGCEGEFGSASVNVTGGTPSYSVSWTNGSTGSSSDQLLPGSYSVTITDNQNCQFTEAFQITEPTIILQSTPILCFGDINGQINATVNNPNPSSIYSVEWDDMNAQTSYVASGLTAGTYTVTISDQFGCILTASETILEPDSLVVFVEHTQLCPNNPISSALVFSSGGQTPYDFLWSNSEQTELITIQDPGSYFVQVTDFNGCQQEAEFTIDPISNLQMSFITQNASCIDNIDGSAEVIVTGGYAPYVYNWTNNNNQPTNNNLNSGIYGVTIIDNNGCQYYEDVEVLAANFSCIKAYSAFSPNGDQNNDYWQIDNIELYPDALVEVFNRWGDRVYSTKRYVNAWNGAFKGEYKNKKLPSATYYYVITLNNDEEPISGTLTIVR